MKTMTATEVSRNFASVLDRAEHGETIVITRGGRRLALLGPASAGKDERDVARRLIFDTGVLTRAERGVSDLATLLEGDDDVALAAVTVAELQFGVELANDVNRNQRQEFVDGMLALVPVEDYTADTARIHARLPAHVRRSGKPRGAHDLIIAATAAATARTIVTTDAKAAFGDLPGVHAVSL